MRLEKERGREGDKEGEGQGRWRLQERDQVGNKGPGILADKEPEMLWPAFGAGRRNILVDAHLSAACRWASPGTPRRYPVIGAQVLFYFFSILF